MIGELISHYRVLRQLGAGGMGVVYLARDEQLGREVALKLLAPDALADDAARDRSRNEAQVLAQLNHPNIEMVFEFGNYQGREFLVLEYVPGQTLREILAGGPLPEEKVLRLGSMLAAGLEAAHAKGILHRDLKPGNLILTPEGRLKILDFGLALAQNTTNPAQDKHLAGTLPYMPPEQLRGQSNDVRSDIYSAGVLLFEMATGRPPFTSTEPSDLIDSILHETPCGACQLNASLSPLLEGTLLKALQKLPENRQQSAAELRGELERIYALRQPAAAGRSLDQSQAPALEMSYVLFMDIVGYSRMATDTQQTTLRRLQRVVRNGAEFQRAQADNRLIRLPTGDGMALAFFTDPEAPVRCAVEISRALHSATETGEAAIPMRIGMHCGPVYRVTDINGNQNVAGEGINVAQRVMDCGDAGHLLVSKVLADVLLQLSGWKGALRDLGPVKVKHGLEIQVFNLLYEGVGNPALPQKVEAQKKVTLPEMMPAMSRRGWLTTVVVVLASVAAIGVSLKYWKPSGGNGKPPVPQRPTVAILGFKNQNNNADAAWVSTTLSDMLSSDLEAGNHLVTTPGEEIVRAKKELSVGEDTNYGEETIQRLHQVLHCDYLVYGAYYAPGKAGGSTVRLMVRLQDAHTGETLASLTENGTEVKLPEIAFRAGASLRTTLKIPSVSPAENDVIQAEIPSTDATKPFYSGIERLRNFDFLGARELLQKAIASDPNFAPAHAGLAETWIGLGYDDKAREEAQTAFDLSKHLSREDQLMVEARFREISNDWEKATNVYQSLWTFNPDNPEYALRVADTQIRGGHGNDAVKTIQMLRGQPGHIATDPRLDLKEAEAYASLGDFAHQKDAANQAVARAQQHGEMLLEAEALWQGCGAFSSLGDAPHAVPLCQQSVAIAQPLSDLMLVARATTMLGVIAENQGDLDRALTSYRQALQYVRRIGSRRDIAGALINIGNIQSKQGDHGGAKKSFQEGLSTAREVNDQQQALTCLNNLAYEYQMAGDLSGALRFFQQSLETARTIQDKAGTGRAIGNIGVIYSMQGRFPVALENIEAAVKTAQETGVKSDQAGLLYSLGDTKLAQGDLTAAESNYQSGQGLAAEINDKTNVAFGQMEVGTLRLQQGKAEEALALGRQAATEFQTEGMKDLESQARNLIALSLLEVGKPAEAAKELDAIRQLAPQDATIKLMVAITASRVGFRQGSATPGKKVLDNVAAEALRIGVPGIQFEARLAQGEAGLFGADKRTALAVLSGVGQEASRKGYKQIEVRAKELSRQIKGLQAG